MGTHTGAGTIFGVTGGVMEAALRTAYYEVTGKDPDPDLFADIRTGPALRERTYTLGGADVHCAVVSGLGNARHLLEAIKAGKVHYDFVEVMACPGGCSGGGGQPISIDDEERAEARGQSLYALDQKMALRLSHRNPQIEALYAEFLGSPSVKKQRNCSIPIRGRGSDGVLLIGSKQESRQSSKSMLPLLTSVFCGCNGGMLKGKWETSKTINNCTRQLTCVVSGGGSSSQLDPSEPDLLLQILFTL